MKKSLALVFLILPIILFSQIQWQQNGVPVNCGDNIYWTGTSVQLSNGDIVYVWSDNRNGDRGIFAQKLSSEGEHLWGDGLLIIDVEGAQHYPAAVLSSDGNVIVTWLHHVNEFDKEIRAQKINQDGFKLWNEDGVSIFTDDDIGINFNLISDDAGGAFVFWHNFHHDIGIPFQKAHHILSSGSIESEWNLEDNFIPFVNRSYFDNIVKDGEGGFVLSWGELDGNLFVQRYDGHGNKLWEVDGVIVDDEFHDYTTPYIITDNSGLFYLTWQTNPEDSNSKKILIQKINLTGDLLLEEDSELHSCEGEKIAPKITITSDNCLAACWQEYWPESASNIAFVKFELDDFEFVDLTHILWDPNTTAWGTSISPDDEGGFWVSWIQNSATLGNGLCIQHLDSQVEKTLGTHGQFIAPLYENYLQSNLGSSIDNEMLVHWFDNSSVINTINMQKITHDGELQFSDPISIIQGYRSSASYPRMLLADESPLFFWKGDLGNSQASVFAQKLDEEGYSQFTENGKLLLNVSHSEVFNFDVAKSNSVYAIISQNFLNGWDKPVAQAINEEGTKLWGEDGIELSETGFQANYVNISTYNNSFYIGWSDYYDEDLSVKAQRLDENGNKLWATNGIELDDEVGVDRLIDIVDNCFIWRQSGGTESNLIMLRLDEDGSVMEGWPEDGLEICNTLTFTSKPHAIPVNDGWMVTWFENNNIGDDLKGQLISADGNLLWQEGGIVLISDVYYGDLFDLVFDENIYLAISTEGEGQIVSKLFCFDLNGFNQFEDDGIEVGVGTNPQLIKVNNQLLTIWQQINSDYSQYDLFGQLLDLNGNIQWNEGGEPICDAMFTQRSPQMLVNDNSDIFISWLDERNFDDLVGGILNPSIFAQKIHLDPLFTPEETLEAIRIALNQNHPNPFNPTTTISFQLNTEITENTEVEIYNVKGQKINSIMCHPEPACPERSRREGRQEQTTYTTTWNGTDSNNNPVASGVYFYKLNVEDSPVKKMVLLK